MNTIYTRILPVLTAVIVLSACSDDDAGVPPVTQNDFSAIINTYVDNTVLATYGDLQTQAASLHESVVALAQNPTQQNLDAAALQWRATREPWEASEGFLFGPVAFLGLDPSMDSWPLDQAQLDGVLSSSFELNADFVRNGLNASLRGFHTLEYLLFRDGQPRDVSSLTTREREYMVAVSQVLKEDTEALYSAWTTGYDGGGPTSFAAEFKNSGKVGSRYTSQTHAIQEILEGMIGIADEVGNGKIRDPFAEQNPAIVESWHSWNSLEDFRNNMKSIQNAYIGGYHKGVRGTGLDTFVKSKDAALDARLKAEIETAITAIDAIPHPFRNNLNASVQINAAIAACNTIMSTLENDVKPLISN